MKFKSTLLALAFVLTSMTAISSAQAADSLSLIASESFDYTGNIVGKNGGTGFTSAWFSDYNPSDYGLNASGLTYTGLTTSGGYIYGCTQTPNTVCGVARNIETQTSGAIYIQFIAAWGSQTGGGTPMLRIFDESGALTGGLGANGGTYGSNISILDATGNPPGDGSASTGVLNSTSLMILKIDYTNNKTSLWLNPTLASFDYLNPPSPTVFINSFAPVVRKLAFYSRNTYSKFDELKIYKIVAGSSSATSEDLLAQAREAEKQRQAKIQQARTDVIKKVSSSAVISKDDLVSADLGNPNPISIGLINKEIAKLKPEVKGDFNTLNKIVRKYETYETLGSDAAQTLQAKELIDLGIIPTNTPQANYIVQIVKSAPIIQRDSVEKINALIQEQINKYQARKIHLAKVLNRG